MDVLVENCTYNISSIGGYTSFSSFLPFEMVLDIVFEIVFEMVFESDIASTF